MAAKQIQKLLSADPILNRIQDQLIGILNPIIRQLGVLPLYTSAQKPQPSADNYGQLIRIKDVGTPELVLCCVSTSAGVFEWITVGMASS